MFPFLPRLGFLHTLERTVPKWGRNEHSKWGRNFYSFIEIYFIINSLFFLVCFILYILVH